MAQILFHCSEKGVRRQLHHKDFVTKIHELIQFCYRCFRSKKAGHRSQMQAGHMPNTNDELDI
ncbi:uncharacterized protein PHALS_11270 [Plasmopara halstedii]|uniref:Uncharacterized protein n=1 Tax=Plasmopara halstedii TaxID=4781 RepID=A0A0P1AJV8_PLAHL|nr:uncharacterized protein PHALS_11270 [Plasmopara halstedii]CEG41105.1 hypothetical protein PHALS_11270 [Plasmopara halstedii]|eukprot:XP_024577474.1 hypothetical protein PHALS_11270 [Plasmopara halstedii]